MEYNKQKRLHLTKEHRLPRCYKEVEKVLRTVKSCQQNYKTILANSKLRGHIHKKVYSMTVNVLKYYSYIQKIIEKIQLLEKEQYLRREIASVLIYELIFGKGFLPGESKVVKIIQIYEKEIFHAHEILQNKVETSLIVETNVPRYVRVHTLVTTVPYVIKDLTNYGFHQVIYDDELSEEKYLELVKNLKSGCFLIDFHFKDMLVFQCHENLVSCDLYKNGHIFLQDKSSYIPVHVLNPQPGCAVLDACAAPGMKTVHIAAKMKNKGILIACERDKSRFECLKQMLDCGSVKICKTFCKDFKLIDPFDQAYSTVEYILLDPSCSGSGMVNRMDEVTDTENSKNTDRLMKLAGFQIILLKHSLKFPAVKRVVYSTCSIHKEENEYVVHEALKAFSGTFKLIPVMPEWSHRGSEKFEFGNLCLRTDPKIHLTNGFFVAAFERIDCNAGKYQDQVCDSSSFKNRKRKSSMLKESSENKIAEGYSEMSTKYEHNISHEMNDSGHAALLNKSNQSSFQNADYELGQNLECIQQINKKQKKREKFYEFNCETSNESSFLYSKSRKHSYDSSLKKDNIESIHARNDKSEHSEYHNKKNLHKNIEIMEDYTELKKKKKHKKIHSEVEISGELIQQTQGIISKRKHKNSKLKQDANCLQSELQDDNDSNFTDKAISAQNNHLRNISYQDSRDFIPVISSHKKKKKSKKVDLNMDYVESHEKLKENNSSLSYEVNDSSNRHQTVRNISINNEGPEELTDSTELHKKKKKKRKHCEKEMLLSNELIQETQNIFSKNNSSLPYEVNDSSNRHQTVRNISVNNEGPEELTDSTELHKKKKKKRKHCEKEMLLSNELIQETQNIFSKNNSSLPYEVNDSSNRHQTVRNISINNEGPEELTDSTELHKKKKKKRKHCEKEMLLSNELIQETQNIPKNNSSLPYEVNDSSNRHQTVRNISISNEGPEELTDSTELHKKKKKKRKHCEKEMLLSNELIQEAQNIFPKQKF